MEQLVTYGIRGDHCGHVSGQFINDVGASLPECAEWIARRTMRACGAESWIGWRVVLWIDGRVALSLVMGG